jgi:ribosomal-protein-alanine N-acetyltransferase
MSYSIEKIKGSIAYCGLVCKLCNAGKTGECKGCREKCDGCSIKECAKTRDINGCWECSQFPCEEKAFKNKRNRVFLQCAKDEGLHSLAIYLKKNYDEGVRYHKTDGSIGDYDILDNEIEILQLLKKRENPFEKCPVYETDNLTFTMVKEEDAEELFQCYSDPITASHMNNDNCGGDWDVSTIDIVKKSIGGWVKEFDAKFYIRWSVTHKYTKRIIGTIEIAPIPNTTKFLDGVCENGILRVDIISTFENEQILTEILKMATENFYIDFDIKNIVIKSRKDDLARVLALKNNRFDKYEEKSIVKYNHYYIKRK